MQMLLFFSSCLHSSVFTSPTSLQCSLPELRGNRMSDGTRGGFQGNQMYPGSESTPSSDGGAFQSLCTRNHANGQQEKVQPYCRTVAATVNQR